MEWRCEWCGKPHEENDPPCDNCGHGTFEKAVVRQTDLSEGAGPESTIVWVCTDCGRTHAKHSPPCSRCGNHKLVREEQHVDEEELVAPGYLDLMTPRYLLALVGVLAIAALFVLGLAGVVSLPIPGLHNGVPQVSGVPGSADTAGNLSLADAETSYVDAFNELRSAHGRSDVTRSERLDDVATFVNERLVKTRYDDGSLPTQDRVDELVSTACEGRYSTDGVSLNSEGYESASKLGEAFADAPTLTEEVDSDVSKIGVDTHTAPDGTVVLTQIVC